MNTSPNQKEHKKQWTDQEKNKRSPKPKQEENLNKKKTKTPEQITKPKIIQTTKQCSQILNLSDGWDLSFTFPQKDWLCSCHIHMPEGYCIDWMSTAFSS